MCFAVPGFFLSQILWDCLSFKVDFFIHYGSIPYLILFVLCQVSMCTSQRKAALCFIPLINTKALNISSPLRKGLWDVTVFNTRCLRNSLHSQSLSFAPLSAVWVCLQLRRLRRNVFCKLFNKGSFSWKQFYPQDPRSFDSTLCTSINKLTILSQSEGKIQLFTNCNA